MGNCPLQIKSVRDFLTVPVHPHGHDVHVLPVYIGVLEDNIGLFSVTHALHKFLRQYNHLVCGQLVFGRGVQREVNDGFPDVGIEVGIVFEGFGALVDMEFAAGTLGDALGSEQLAFVVLDFNVVVGQHAVDVAAVIDGGDHGLFFRFLNSNFVLFLPLTKFFCQGYHLLYQLFQLQGFLREFVEESQCFLLPVNRVNRLYALVVVVSYRPELGVKLGQPDVKVVGIFVFRDDCKISTEYPCPDKIGGVSGLRSSEHGQEFLVFLVVQSEVIAMCSRVGKDNIPCRISCLISFSHKTAFKRLISSSFPALAYRKGSTWENRPAFRIHFGGGLSAGGSSSTR